MNDEMSMSYVQAKILELNAIQIDLFFSFGLRQTKWFFEKDYNRAVTVVPEGATIEGINSFGRIQARNTNEMKRYGFFCNDCTWSETTKYEGGGEVVALSDLEKLYNSFELSSYTFDALTHVPNNYKAYYQKISSIPS